jgi:hypothetical protein
MGGKYCTPIERIIDLYSSGMGHRKRFLDYDDWAVRPHADRRPRGLWWWHDLLPQESRRVVCVYFERRTYVISKHDETDLSLLDRWRQVCDDFSGRNPGAPGSPDDIERIIGLVTTPNSTSRSAKERGCFMTLEGAALQLGLKRANVYSWFRKLEKIASELYPDKYHSSMDAKYGVTKPVVAVKEEMKEVIRAEYFDKGNAKELAERHRLPAFRIGQIVKTEKKLRKERYTVKAGDDVPY